MKALLALLVFWEPTSSCTDCSEVCTDSIAVDFELQAAAASLSGDTLQVCKNSECADAVLPVLSGSSASEVPLSGGFAAYAVITWSATSTSFEIDFMNSGPYVDGDTYNFAVSSGSGVPIASDSGSATYKHLTSCGNGCTALVLQL
jgi:hypothetical protein